MCQRQKELKERFNALNSGEVLTLEHLAQECEDSYELVVTFLAILNLINENHVRFTVRKDAVYLSKGD